MKQAFVFLTLVLGLSISAHSAETVTLCGTYMRFGPQSEDLGQNQKHFLKLSMKDFGILRSREIDVLSPNVRLLGEVGQIPKAADGLLIKVRGTLNAFGTEQSSVLVTGFALESSSSFDRMGCDSDQ